MAYNDTWYPSDDGLQLYARDYPNDQARLSLLCMHGLTRNSADFASLAEDLQDEYRVVAMDQRGRGRSEWDGNPANYNLVRYVADMFTLIDRLALRDIVLLGTSMGGMMAMTMAGVRDLFRGVVLNDIGPVVSAEGLARIKGYVGKGRPVRSWEDAIEQTIATSGTAFPHYVRSDWERWVRRTYAENEAGQPELLYDPAIARSLGGSDGNAVPPNTWRLFDGLRHLPCLTLRGALSDILGEECCAEMQRRHPGMALVTVTGVGHAPMLDESGIPARLREFLRGC